MPFYEYECSACKFYVEALQKLSDEPLRKCPSCKKTTLKRLISVPVFRLKGGGWYETDFKSDNEQKRNIHERDEAEAKADAKAETKPAETKGEAAPAKGEATASKGEAAAGQKAASGSKPAARTKAAPAKRAAKAKPKAKSSSRSKARRRR
jgi:putative FmdB family regulatory protein